MSSTIRPEVQPAPERSGPSTIDETATRESWPAPAKLNLFLHVNGRRDDGYHDIQTLFQLIDWVDDVHISLRDDGQIVRDPPLEGVPEDQDLTIRAARLLTRRDPSQGATIGVTKRIPMGAGLGGGSSDAATVLCVLNELWGLGLPRVTLGLYGRRLGADVPIFVHGWSAWASGVGNKLWSAELGNRYYVVIWPGVSVSTAAVFSSPKLTRDTPTITMPAGRLDEQFRNDLQSVVIHHHPEVAKALNWLADFGLARMSGSGSSVFVQVETLELAEEIVAQVPSEWTASACSGLDRSPLRQKLASREGRRAKG